MVYASGTPGIFSVRASAKTLNEVIERKGIETMFKNKLVEIRPDERKAIFAGTESSETPELDYDMIHITPPQGPPDVIKGSLLATMRGGGASGFKSYDGYASCPLTTGDGKPVLAEFDYDLNPTSSIPLIDTTKGHAMMKGRA